MLSPHGPSKWILVLDCFHFLKPFPAGILHGDNSYLENMLWIIFKILKYILTYFLKVYMCVHMFDLEQLGYHNILCEIQQASNRCHKLSKVDGISDTLPGNSSNKSIVWHHRGS